MVKISTVSRTPKSFNRKTKYDLHKVSRLIDNKSQPFQATRELKRASNAAKISKIFAKPFIGALSGHSDYISCIAKNRTELNVLASGGFDGELLLWDIQSRKYTEKHSIFEGRVNGLAVSEINNQLICTGDEFFVHLYKVIITRTG